jgi:hypothetical protein
MDALEAMAQELLAEFPEPADADDARNLRGTFRPVGPGDEKRKENLEDETERWSMLDPLAEWPAPDVRFDDSLTAEEVDARIREVAKLRAGWDAIIAWLACAVKKSRLYERFGFTNPRHYLEERLQLPPRGIEQRVALEERIWKSPALQEARRHKLPYEKLRLLAKLAEKDIPSWIPRAQALTCAELKHRIDAERERQMRTAGKISAVLPRRIAVVLAAAIQAVRDHSDGVVSTGKCLAVIAGHFIETWKPLVRRRKTRSQKVRKRDGDRCQVPGCSHVGWHSHHVEFLSHGGSDDLRNQIAICPFHHLVCIHRGYLRVTGLAPDALEWSVGGKRWTGPRSALV